MRQAVTVGHGASGVGAWRGVAAAAQDMGRAHHAGTVGGVQEVEAKDVLPVAQGLGKVEGQGAEREGVGGEVKKGDGKAE